MQVVATHHIAVNTSQFEVMERFYTQTLGFPVTKRWDDVSIIFIDVGSTTIELIARKANDAEPGPHPIGEGIGFNHLALGVADVDRRLSGIDRSGRHDHQWTTKFPGCSHRLLQRS